MKRAWAPTTMWGTTAEHEQVVAAVVLGDAG
jgi:hypothetical protein